MIYIVVLLILKSVIVTNTLVLPKNPCPEIFQYQSNDGVKYNGEVVVPYDGSTNLNLQVNSSLVGLYQNIKLKIYLLTPLDENVKYRRDLKYRIEFPLQNVIPKITRIEFNGNTHCIGPPEPLGVKGVSYLWAHSVHHLFTYSIISDNNNNREQFANPNTPLPQLPPRSPSTTTTITEGTPSVNYEKKCGLVNNIQTLVINGEAINGNEYPWMVAMLFLDNDGLTYKFHCTANLISTQHVITAGHCLQFHKAPLLKKDDILFILGRSDLTHWATDDGAIKRSALQIHVHPQYHQFSGHGDAAVVKLNSPVQIKNNILPICLWKGDVNLDSVVGEIGIVSGWGQNELGSETSPRAMKVKMPIVSQVDCLRSNPVFNNITSELTFCAGGRDGKGPCTGDSGAGFILERNGRWYLRGTVSQAIKEQNSFTCNLNSFIVFSDSAKNLNWIQSVIKM